MNGMWKSAIHSIGLFGLIALLGACGNSNSGSTGLNPQPRIPTMEDVVITAAKQSGVTLSHSEILGGQKLLAQVQQSIVLTSNEGNQTQILFNHEVDPLGEFQDNETGTVSDDILSGNLHYTAQIPLSVPLKIRPSYSRIELIDKKFYSASLTREYFDSRGRAKITWHDLKDQGYNLFAVFQQEYQKQYGDATYYYGSFDGIGSFGGYITQKPLPNTTKMLVDLHIIMSMTKDLKNLARITLRFID